MSPQDPAYAYLMAVAAKDPRYARFLLHDPNAPPPAPAKLRTERGGERPQAVRQQAGQKGGCGGCGGRKDRPQPAPAPPQPAPAPPLPYQQAGRPVGERHLLYHLLPAGNGVWRRGIDHLRSRWSLFTGKRVVAIVTGGSVKEQGTGKQLRLDSLETVRNYLPHGCEVVEVRNDPARWEGASWPLLWKHLAEADPDDAVLYCHAKGVTRPASSPAHRWADLLYSLCLDHWPRVEELLQAHPVVGPLLKPGRFFASARPNVPGMDRCRWHYSGNFFWSRLGTARERLAAVPVPVDPWGPEAWAGIAYSAEEAGNLWSPTGAYDLYQEADLERVEVEHRAWLSTQPRPAVRPRLSVILPTSGRDTIGRTLASITPQLLPGDEVIVMRDDSGDWGATPRNRGMLQARGDLLLFMDDDDVYLPGAFEAVRRAAVENPGKPLLFRMRRGAPVHDVLPHVREVRVGQVSTQMVVVPNDPERLGVWAKEYTADFAFIRSTLEKYPPGAVVWRDEVIAVWRPED